MLPGGGGWGDRLDNQEMELRDYSNLRKEFNTLSLKNKDLVYRVATVNGLLEVGTAFITSHHTSFHRMLRTVPPHEGKPLHSQAVYGRHLCHLDLR